MTSRRRTFYSFWIDPDQAAALKAVKERDGVAAEQGHLDAQFNLGNEYTNGEGVPQDHVEAVRWFRLAADQGYAAAQFRLGLMYGNGQGVPPDAVIAHTWFNLAASGSTGDLLDRAVHGRDLAETRLTASQRAESERLARELDAAHPRG